MNQTSIFAEETATTSALSEPIAVPAKKVVKVKWATNYNKKLGCPGMVHLDMAPSNMPRYSQLETSLVEISTEDESHEPIQYELLDIVPLDPGQVRDHFTMASHGINADEFAEYAFTKYSAKQLSRQGIALYIYRRLPV
jgi:hypothetical protein